MDHLIRYYINNSRCTFLEGAMPVIAKVRRRWCRRFSPYPEDARASYNRRLFQWYLELLSDPTSSTSLSSGVAPPTPPVTPVLHHTQLTSDPSSSPNQAHETQNGDYQWLSCHFFMPVNRPRLVYWTSGAGAVAMGPAISVVPVTTSFSNSYGVILSPGMALVAHNVTLRLVYIRGHDHVELQPGIYARPLVPRRPVAPVVTELEDDNVEEEGESATGMLGLDSPDAEYEEDQDAEYQIA